MAVGGNKRACGFAPMANLIVWIAREAYDAHEQRIQIEYSGLTVAGMKGDVAAERDISFSIIWCKR